MPVKITKRKDGRYQKQIPVGKDDNGKMHYTYAYGRTQKELEENSTRIRNELDRGLSPRDRNQTFLTAANAWLAGDLRGVSDRTLRWYKGIVKNHLKELHDKKLIDLDATDLQRILNRLAQEGKAKRTVASVRQVAISVMDYAVTKDIVVRNKFDKKQTKIPDSAPKAVVRVPLNEEQEKLVRTQWKNHRMGVPALIM